MQNLQKLFTTFLSHCTYEKRLSEKTIKAYSIDLDQLKKYLSQQNLPLNINFIDKYVLRSFIQSISDFKPKTVKRKIATIKAFFNFLEYEDEILINPFRKFKISIKEPKILPGIMNLEEIEKILSIVYKDKASEKQKYSYRYAEKVRNTAIIEILFATGARVSEISSLKESCINLDTGQVKLTGKGNKERIIQICNQEVITSLKEYYHIFHQKIHLCNGYFFINRFNNRLSEQSIRNIVKEYAHRAGINRNITPHAFRHSFATLLLEEDVDIKYIQHLLGHSSIMTTQIYTHVNSEKQKKILTENHPRKNLVFVNI